MAMATQGRSAGSTARNGINLGKRKPPLKRRGKGLRFGQLFCPAGVSPFDTVEWEFRTAEITDDSGKIIFKQENVEVPKSWSVLATKIAVSKYFYGDPTNGFDPHQGGRENSIRQLIHRVTRTITNWGIADGYFATKQDAEHFYNDLTWLCLHQHGAFNSPVWFNVGLFHEYGVGKNSGQGNYFFDRTQGRSVRAATAYEYPQCSACFIQGVDDTMESIMELAKSEAMLFKFGSGTGSDLSTLRSTREKNEWRWMSEWSSLVPQSLRSNCQCGEVRRQDTSCRQDEYLEGLASRYRRVHRCENERREKSPGID
jgi:ribonucleoside-diphosphate reductase alpha chain